MGVELELSVLLVCFVLGTSVFDVFEVETPVWRKVLKWAIVIGGTVGLYFVVGHAAVVFPLVAGGIGLLVHFSWCQKHGIHPIYATPRRKYYQLRQWEWPE